MRHAMRKPIYKHRSTSRVKEIKQYLRIVSMYNIENEKASRQNDTKAGEASHNDIQVLWNDNFIPVDNCRIMWNNAICKDEN